MRDGLRAIKDIRGKSGLKGWQAAAALAALLFCFFTMFYNDMAITLRYGLVFWDAAFDGKLLSFYEQCVLAAVTPEGAVYDMGIYILFGIWALPVKLVQLLTGADALSAGSILWFKLLPVLFLILDAGLVRKIVTLAGGSEEDGAKAAVMYLLSLFTFFPVFIAVQYDVIILYFLLRGIEAYGRGDYRKSILWVAVSMTMKPFPVFILAVIVLMHEKNIFRIMAHVAAGAVPMLVCKALYSLNKSYQDTNASFLTGKFDRLFSARISVGPGEISLFVAVILAVYVAAWLQESRPDESKPDESKPDESKQDFKKTLWFCLAAWLTFAVCCDVFPYWLAYAAPFIIMMIYLTGRECREESGAAIDGKNPECVGTAGGRRSLNKRDILLWLELAGSGAVTIVFIVKYYWVYGGSDTYKSLLLKGLWGSKNMAQKNTTVGGGLARFLPPVTDPALMAVYVVCLVSIAVITAVEVFCAKKMPVIEDRAEGTAEGAVREKGAVNAQEQESGGNAVKAAGAPEAVHYVLRILVMYGWILLTLAALFMEREAL